MLALLVLSMLLAGCEEDLTGRGPSPMPYSVYGVISPDFDTQSIRVYPLESFPTLGMPSLGADVGSIDLTTGSRQTWRDTVLVDPNGRYEYIFWSPFRAEYGHTYRVEVVRRSDGATASAEVEIPEIPAFEVTVFEVPVVQLYVEGENIRVLKPEALYTVNRDVGNLPLRTIRVSHEGEERRVDGGWRVSIDMREDTDKIVSKYAQSVDTRIDKPEHCGALLILRRLELSVIVGDAAWDPPGGFLDPIVLSEPRTMSNVEKGFGFVGGGYRITAPAFPPPEAVGGTCLTYGIE